MTTQIYTIGNGKRHQFAKRADGVWFVRGRFREHWTKWVEHGRSKPHEFGMYLALPVRLARLP